MTKETAPANPEKTVNLDAFVDHLVAEINGGLNFLSVVSLFANKCYLMNYPCERIGVDEFGEIIINVIDRLHEQNYQFQDSDGEREIPDTARN